MIETTDPPESPLMSLCPHYPPADVRDGILCMGWLGCVEWALREPEFLAAFEKESGMHYSAPKTPPDRMIDEAAGYNAGPYVLAFAKWVTENLWGHVDGEEEEEG